MKRLFTAFRRDDAGAAMAEYAILVAFIALVAIVGVQTTGTQLNISFDQMAQRLECGGSVKEAARDKDGNALTGNQAGQVCPSKNPPLPKPTPPASTTPPATTLGNTQ